MRRFPGSIPQRLQQQIHQTQSRKRQTFALEIDLYAAENTDKFLVLLKRIVNAMIASNTKEFQLKFSYMTNRDEEDEDENLGNIYESLLRHNVTEYCKLAPKIELQEMSHYHITISTRSK